MGNEGHVGQVHLAEIVQGQIRCGNFTNLTEDVICQFLQETDDQFCDISMRLIIVYISQNLIHFQEHLYTSISLNLVFMVLFCTFGNSLIIVSILRSPNLHTPSYILITCLAFSDLLVGFVFHTMTVAWNIHLLKTKTDDLCAFMMSFTTGAFCLANISLGMSLLLSIDRYLALVSRERYRYILTKKNTVLSILVVYAVSLAVTFLPLATVKERSKRHSIQGFFGMTCLVAITTFYVRSFRSLYGYTLQLQPQQANEESSFNLKKYRKSLKTMLMILVCLVVCYMPVLGSSFVWKMSKNIDFNVIFQDYALLAFALNSSINPLIYLARFKDIRKACRQILRCQQTLSYNEISKQNQKIN